MSYDDNVDDTAITAPFREIESQFGQYAYRVAHLEEQAKENRAAVESLKQQVLRLTHLAETSSLLVRELHAKLYGVAK